MSLVYIPVVTGPNYCCCDRKIQGCLLRPARVTYLEIVSIGNGKLTKTVQLNMEVVRELRLNLKSLGHSSLSLEYPFIPLTTALPSSGPLGSSDEPLDDFRLYRELNDFLRGTATSLIKMDCYAIQKLRSVLRR